MSNLIEQFYHPAEWHTHESTWLSWPHNTDTWPEEYLLLAQKEYIAFVGLLSMDEKVNINVNDRETVEHIGNLLDEVEHKIDNILLHLHPTNDAWIRDHGPDFLISNELKSKLILDWKYNAWGDKYPPYDLDNVIPTQIADATEVSDVSIDMVLEGGSVDFNGEGVILTTEECLLNKNRNPNFNKQDIESHLHFYYQVDKIIWLKGDLVGDDTDGHIDNVARFVNKNTIVCAWENDEANENSICLKWNYEFLKNNYPEYTLVKLPMPTRYQLGDLVLPASYANFYIANNKVIVPTYGLDTDQVAIDTLTPLFPNHKVIGLSAKYLIWGQGSFHCLSKQEPKV